MRILKSRRLNSKDPQVADPCPMGTPNTTGSVSTIDRRHTFPRVVIVSVGVASIIKSNTGLKSNCWCYNYYTNRIIVRKSAEMVPRVSSAAWVQKNYIIFILSFKFFLWAFLDTSNLSLFSYNVDRIVVGMVILVIPNRVRKSLFGSSFVRDILVAWPNRGGVHLIICPWNSYIPTLIGAIFK